MLWGGVLDIIQSDLNRHYSQFISIDDLISMLQQIQPNNNREAVVSWLVCKKELLRKSKYLLFLNDCEIIEYSEENSYNLPSPIDVIRKLNESPHCLEMHTEMVGFAKQRLLFELRNDGLPITDKMIEATHPYIPNSVTQSKTDEMAYIFNTFQDMLDLQKCRVRELPRITNDIERLPPMLQAAFGAHRRINILGHYAGERGTTKKVKTYLCDHHPIYKENSFLIKSITTMINSPISSLIDEDNRENNLIDVAENIKSIGFKAHFKTVKKGKTS